MAAHSDRVSLPARSGALSRDDRWLLAFVVLALVVRVATLPAYPLMDNTEARYAEVARKMVETGDWLTPQIHYGVPFWSKPPLSMWMTAVSYLAFGVNEFAARLPSFLACLAAAWLAWTLSARRNGIALALPATVVLVTTPLWFISAGAVMTDPALLLGTTLSMVGFWEAVTREGRARVLWGYAFFLGLAIGMLAKGPVGVVLTLLPVGVWTLWKGGIVEVWRRLPWISGTLLAAALAIPWYIVAEIRTPGYLDYFLIGEHFKRYTIAGWSGDMFGTAHARPRGTIWLLALVVTLPWCAALAGLLWRRWRARDRNTLAADDGWNAYLWLWALAPAVFFTLAGNVLWTYVLPGLPAFAMLVAEAWNASAADRPRWISLKAGALIVPLGFLAAALLVLPRVAEDHSHKALVAQYMALRQSDAERLVYFEEAPQSAEFYARGKVVTAARAADLEPYLHDAPRDFFVFKDSRQDGLPGVGDQLTVVGRYGRYTLFQER
jgi:4-amino-4-deoxy-L-arabinose transferase-like glycosyltransferase